jgi:hypothetical protein
MTTLTINDLVTLCIVVESRTEDLRKHLKSNDYDALPHPANLAVRAADTQYLGVLEGLVVKLDTMLEEAKAR